MRVRPRVTPTVLPDTDTTTNTSGKGGVGARTSECNQVLGREATPLSLFKDPCDRAPVSSSATESPAFWCLPSVPQPTLSTPWSLSWLRLTALPAAAAPCPLCRGCVQQAFQEAAQTASTPRLITLLVALFYALLCH